WVARSVIVAAVTKLATMFNPAGAVIQAVIATYNTVMFFIERAKQIAALLEAVVDSISNIAQGAIGAAVAFVEQAMVRGLTVAIGFLARLIGLGDVAGHVRRIIGRIQAVVDRALDRVIGFIVERGGALLRGKGQQAPPAAAAAGAADAPAADTLHERKEGGHTIRVRRDLSVVQLSTPTSVSGDRAQQARQKALEALVPRKPVRYPMDGDRAAGPIGHVEDVKSGEARAPMSFRGPGYQPGDHRGHLVGDRFWGPPEGRNLVPMHRELNLSTFKRFENEAAKKFLALKRAGQAVLLWMRAIPNYPAAKADDPARYRPTSVSASARISGLKAGSSPVEEETIDPGPLQNPPP
ncbi:MAG TPA: DNA/RNA non-specific endonuclease, partial [Solirubrobacterales bacterium]